MKFNEQFNKYMEEADIERLAKQDPREEYEDELDKKEAYKQNLLRQDEERDIRLFMGNPEDIHYFDDLEGRLNVIRRAVHSGVKFITAYVKPGKDGYYYSLKPLPDISHGEFKEYQPALVPEEDLTK